MARKPRKRAKSPKRDWPPVDLPLWRSIPLRRPLHRYRLETLLRLFDRRPWFALDTHPDGLDVVGRAILLRLVDAAHQKILKVVPGKGDADEELREELKGVVLDHILSRKGPWSYRKHFLSTIRFLKRKLMSKRAKEAALSESLDGIEEGEADRIMSMVDRRASSDRLEDQRRRDAINGLLAGIADPEQREAMRRYSDGETYTSIGMAMGRDRGTVTRWIRQCLPEPVAAGENGVRRGMGGGR